MINVSPGRVPKWSKKMSKGSLHEHSEYKDDRLPPWEEIVGELTDVRSTQQGVLCVFQTTVQTELIKVDTSELETFLGSTVSLLNTGTDYRLRTANGEVLTIPTGGDGE